MLKFKLSENPPPRACLIGFYHGTRIDSETNVGFDDRSWEWPENRTGYEQVIVVHKYGTIYDPAGSAEIVVGNVSARRRDLTEPTPLPWGNRLGEETRYRAELLVYNPLADGFDPDPAGGDQAEEALAELKRTIEILNIDGTPATDVIWDPALVPRASAPVDDGRVTLNNTGGVFGWRVFIYVDRQTTSDRPLIVRYNSVEQPKDSTGAVTTIDADDLVYRFGHEELLRPEPYLSGSVIEPGSAIPASNDYALELSSNATFKIVSAGVVNPAMAIALWTDLANRGWSVVSTGLDRDLVLYDTTGPTELGRVTSILQRSIREVVHEVNKLNLEIKATALVDYPSAELQVTGVSISDITSIGSDPLLLDSHFFAYYFNESKMYIEPPSDDERYDNWLAVVSGSPVRYVVQDPTSLLDGYELTYNIGEHSWAPISLYFNTANGFDKDYLEAIDDPVEFITGSFIALKNNYILSESMRLMSNGKDITNLIEDFDETVGIIKLNRNVIENERITSTHAYDPQWKTHIEFLNFNPGQLHLSDGYRLYFGVYVVPRKIVAPGGTVSMFAPNIGYAVANTISEVVAAIQNLADASSGLPVAAQLLGVFQNNSQGDIEEVKILDIRTGGGGLEEDVDLRELLKRAPEAQFFSDIGYWEGEPYAGHGVLIIRAPQRILGDDDSPVDSPADGGFALTDGRERLDDVKERINSHLTVGMTGLLDAE